jgi:hypothetical protein
MQRIETPHGLLPRASVSSHGRGRPSSAPVVVIEYLIDELPRADVLAIEAQLQGPDWQIKSLRPPLRPGGDDAIVHERNGARSNDDAETC